MKLIICEKPSLALNVAKALGDFQKKDGYFVSGNYLITFAFGHLFQLKNINDYLGEKKKWHEVPLPFIPEKFEFILKKDEGVRKQFNIIKGVIDVNPIDEIIHCGDADREGQIIIDTLIKNLNTKIKVSRLWLPEQTHETIRKELKNLSPNENYLNLAQEGYARTYLTGSWELTSPGISH